MNTDNQQGGGSGRMVAGSLERRPLADPEAPFWTMDDIAEFWGVDPGTIRDYKYTLDHLGPGQTPPLPQPLPYKIGINPVWLPRDVIGFRRPGRGRGGGPKPDSRRITGLQASLSPVELHFVSVSVLSRAPSLPASPLPAGSELTLFDDKDRPVGVQPVPVGFIPVPGLRIILDGECWEVQPGGVQVLFPDRGPMLVEARVAPASSIHDIV